MAKAKAASKSTAKGKGAKSSVPKKESKPAKKAAPPATRSSPSAPVEVQPREFFEKAVPAMLAAAKDAARAIGAVYHFQLLGQGGGNWVIDTQTLEVRAGSPARSDLYVEMNVPDFTEMMRGELSGEVAANRGLLRARGNVQLLSLFGRLIGNVRA